MDYTNYPPYMQFENQNDSDMFNPMVQYEQAYTYYKYLCMQMDYKIKCKEFENICNNDTNKKTSTTVSNSNK